MSQLVDVEVSTLVFGESEPSAAVEPVRISFHTETVSIRELIARTVEEQVQNLIEKQKHSATRTQAILSRQYLSEEDILDFAKQGNIRFPAPRATQAINIEAEINKALHGFRQQRFFISIDGQQPESLDDKVLLSQYSRVFFIRLTPLVGG